MNYYNSLDPCRDTGSKRTWRKKLALLAFFVMFSVLGVQAQVSVTVTNPTNTTPNLSASYTSLAAALTDLNAVSAMSGPVTLTLAAGSETAPATGFTVGSATLNPVLSSTNTVTIVASGSVTLNAGTGTATPASATPDGIFKIVGADWVTLDGITFTDGNAANPATMEFGVGLFKLSATDGAQNNTIRNCTINMQRINNASGSGPMVEGSIGILMVNSTPTAATTSLTPTAASGSNSNNKFYTNAINSGNYGIVLNGFAASTGVGPTPNASTFLGDLNNDIGGASALTGNTILNYGGAAAATNPAAGIRANNQWSVNISYNTVNNNNGSGVNHVTTLRGIFGQAGTSANATINNNTVTLKGGATTSTITAIDNAIGGTAAANTININNNTVTNCDYSTATSGVFNGILNSASAATVNINGNTISNSTLPGTGTHVMIETGSPTTANSNNNSLSNLTRTGASGSWRGIKTSSPSTWNCNNNTIEGLSWSAAASTGSLDAIYSLSSALAVNITGNIVRNLSTPTTGTINGIREFGSGANKTIQNNQVYNFSTTSGGVGGATFNGIFCSTGTIEISGNVVYNLNSTGTTGGTSGAINGIQISGGTATNIFRNKIYNLSSTSTGPVVSGLLFTGNTSNTAHNNLIGDLKAPAANLTSDAIRGISSTNTTGSTAINLYYNTVYLNGTSTGTNFNTSGVFHTTSTTATTATLTMRNNVIVNTSTPNGTGTTVAYRRSSGAASALANYASASNNNLFYAGTPGATRLIYSDGTSTAQTMAAYKAGVFTAGTISPRDQVSVSEAVNFLSTDGNNSNFLHIDGSIASQIESGAAVISGFGTDFDNDTRNASTPDIGADEFTGVLLDLTAPNISYTALPNGAVGVDQTLTATITDASGVPTSGAGLPVLYYNVNGGAYTAVTGVSIGSNQYTFTFGAATTLIGDIVNYYVVAQDNAGTPNIGAFPSAGTSGLTANPPASATPPTTPSTFSAVGAISGIKTVCASGCDYTSLTNAGGAFATINASAVTGNIEIQMAGDSTAETGANALNAFGSPYTVKIYPTGAARVVSGTLNSNGLIRLNGADRVTIDGSINGTGTDRSMTVTNTGTTSPTAIALVSLGAGSGANTNTVKNLNVSTGSAAATSIGIAVGGAAGSSGADNDNVTIQNNNITTVSKGIYAFGTTAVSAGANDNLVISGNSVTSVSTSVNFGIQVGNALNASVDNNTISVESSAADQPTGISLEAGFLNSVVSKNLITKVAATNTGGYGGRGITIGTGSATSNVVVSNNSVAGVTGTNWTAFGNSSAMGIGVGVTGNGSIATTTGGVSLYYNSVNMVGNYVQASTATLSAGLYVGSGATALDIRNNIFLNAQDNTGATTDKNYAVYSAAAAGAFTTMNYNDYFVSGAQGIMGFIGSDRTDLAGMIAGFGGNANSINVNPSFNSATNLQPQAAGVTGVGTPIAGITTDLLGATRNNPPSLGAYENIADTQGPVITYTALGNTCTTGARTLSVTISDATSGVPTSGAGLPVLYWRVNAGAYSAATGVFVSGNQYDFVFGGSAVSGDTVSYYVVAQDGSNNVTVSPSAGAAGFTANPPAAATAPTTPSSYLVLGTLAGTFNVGTGQTYTSLTAAVAAYNAACVTGPVTFVLTDTSYSAGETFPIVINANPASSSTNTLTIKPATTATITGSSATVILKINGGDYVTIDGSNNGSTSKDLTIENTNTGTSSAVVWMASTATDGATNNTIKNTIVKGNAPATTFAGIVASGSTLGGAAEVANTNTSIVNNTVIKSQYGIASAGFAGQTGLVITDNTIGSATATDYIGWRGMFVSNASGAVVSRNNIFNIITTITNPTGIFIAAGVVNSTFDANRIDAIRYSGASGYGGKGIDVNTGNVSSNLTISNNQISNLGGDGWNSLLGDSIVGIRIGATGGSTTTTGGINLYYNSVYLNGTFAGSASGTASAALYVSSTATSLDIRNNIFATTLDNTNATDKSWAINSAAASGIFTNIDYNDYWVSGAAGVLGFLTSDATSLAALQTAFGQNAASLNIQPNFTSTSDLHLQVGSNSGLDNLGTPIAGITTDIDGTTRSATTPDMGIDEFTTLTCSGATAGTASVAAASFCTSGSTTLSATGFSIGQGSLYEWERSVDAGFTVPISMGAATTAYADMPTGTITATTYYRLKVTCNAGAPDYSNVVSVTIFTPATLTVSPNVTICSGNNTTLTVSGAVTYTWSPAAGLSATTGASVTANPTSTTTYSVVGVDSNGCTTAAGTVTVTVNTYPSAISINSTGSLCTGQILTLTATGGNAVTTGNLGTGTTLNATTGYPSPYSNYYGGNKHQMLIRASELTAMGMVAGSQITALRMNVSAVGSSFTGSLNSFQIAMKHTASTTLTGTSFETGLGTVYGPTTQAIPTTGLPASVTHTFSSAFTWNGTDNIVIQTAYDNSNSGTTNYNVQMTNSDPGFSSTNYYRVDSSTIATILAATTPSGSGNARPNMVLSFTAPVSKVWSPLTDLYTDAGANTAYTGGNASTLYFKSSTGNPVTYTVTADNAGCVTTGEIDIEPLPLPVFTVADATICNGDSTSLSAVGVGNTYAWSPTTGLSASTGQTVTANPTVTTTYTVTATNNTTGCQSQETVTVTVNNPVVLTGIGISPVNPTVLDTTPVTFTANATGTGLTYQWYESPDGGATWNPMSGETGQTLVVTADADANDGYQYYCTITPASPCLPEDTGVATLTVSTLGFTAQPQNQTICSNDAGPAEMSVTATTDDPETTIEYAWEVSSDNGATFLPVVDGPGLVAGLSEITFLGSASDTLEISGYSATTPNLVFHCTLNGLFTSDDATLTINAAPAVTTSPSNQTVCAGGSTSFTAAGNASGDPVTYSWEVSTNGGTSWSPVSNGAGVSGATTATLNLSGISASADGYQYHALVSGLSPCAPAVSAAATLTVINPLISVQPPVLTTVVQGNSTSISATATGATTYQWTFSTTAGGTYTALNENDVIGGNTYTNVTTQTLSIATSATSTAGNAYYYKLVASNGTCSVTSNAGQMNITTYCAPPGTTFTSSGGDSDSITNVIITNVTESTNITQASSGAVAPWYTFYDTPVLNVTQGQSMSTAITFNTDGTQHSAIWVDWNRNGVFEASENVALSTTAAGGGATVTYNFTVPMTATPGNTRIRVRGASDSAYTAAGACATTAWGEVEDYVLNVVQAPACSGTPVAGTITSTGDICISGTATLTVAGYSSGVTGISLQWYDGDTNLPISGQTNPSYTTPTLTASHNYFVRVTCANGGGFADASFNVVVNNPSITGTTPNSRCGAGTVTLGATASSGTVNWYAAASGGTPLFTGNSYTTPVITTTTNYYVSASAGGSVTNAGKASSPGTDGSFISTGYGVVFTASTALTVQSAVIYPTGTGTITLAIQNSSGTEIGATAAIPVTGSGISTPVTVPIGIAVPAGTGYRLIVKAYTGITNIIRDFTNTFPYAGPVATVTGGWTGSASTAYYFFYNLTVSNACESARTMVTATVTPAPALTLSSATSTICAGDTSAPVTITSTVGDFDSYSWAPTTGVSGNENSGYTFNPTSTTTYTLTATNSTSGCSNIATHTVTVNPLPDVFTITPSAPSKCLEDAAVLLSVTRTNAAPVNGCLASDNGQWPSGTYTVPTCNGTTVNNVTTNGFTSEYSVVNVVVGNKYTFGSSGVGDEITISDSTGTTILAAGPSPLVWYNNGSTQIRFYSQRPDCSNDTSGRTRSIICQTMPGAVFSPTTGLYTNAAGTIAYTGTAVQQVYAAPTSTQSYTATATSLGCPRTANVTVTVKPVPTATAPATMDLCAGITTTPVALVGTPSGVTFDITGGGAVGLATQIGVTAIPAFTPTVGTATVTITPKADGCTGAAVTFLIKVSPTTVGGAVTGGTTICMNNTSGVLTLAGHTGNVVRWESSVAPFSVWTPIANTSTTYTSGALTQTTQFRAVVQSGTCQEQASTETTVNVNQVTLSSTTAASVCVNTEAVVTLSGMVPNTTATIAYNKTGVPQTPVNVTVDGSGVATFNVMVTGAGQNVVITSITRTDVTPNCPITPSTGNSVSFVISTQCSQVQGCNVTLAAIDSSILANIVANVQGYRWRVTTLNGPNANLVQTLDTPLRTMKLVQLANYAFATQYQIEVATLRSGVWGPYSAGCTITTPAATTQLTNCSGTLSSLSDAVYANLVPYAAGYRFRITDPVNGANTQTLDRSVRDFKMTMITNFVVQYGKTYNVEVAVKNTDGTYMTYSGICQVTTPVFPTTSLQDSQCDDYEVPSNTTLIYAFSYPGAIGYAFQLTGPGLPPAGVEVVKNVRTFSLSDFASAGLIPGATYNVKVRLIFNLADPAGPYGKTCTIVTPGASRVAATKVAFNAVAFPNPFAENFNIDVTTSLDSNINVKVYDMTGRLLETREVKVSDIESLQVGDRYPSGVYNVIVTQGENVKTLRVIKR